MGKCVPSSEQPTYKQIFGTQPIPMLRTACTGFNLWTHQHFGQGC